MTMVEAPAVKNPKEDIQHPSYELIFPGIADVNILEKDKITSHGPRPSS